LLTLIQRLRLPESTKMKNVQAMRDDPSLLMKGKLPIDEALPSKGPASTEERGVAPTKLVATKKRAFFEFAQYFSEWRHLKYLLGTAGSWFLLDITFYGINLNQSIVIQAIGLASSKEPWEYLYQLATANIIIAAAGFLPGYYVTLVSIEYIGRKRLQFIGFIMEAFFLAILAGDFTRLQKHHAGFVVCFAFLQFFFNFGANSTTFIMPAEVFPTRVRGFAHGFSAACGKTGAVIASLGFATAATHIGTSNVLWIFFGISLAGACCTILVPETTGRDADLVDLQERQHAAGYDANYHGSDYQNGANGSSIEKDSAAPIQSGQALH